jgi:hypothetical protein
MVALHAPADSSAAQNFFPKWHAVLHAWLSAAPNFDEVTRWYLGWKSLFPEEVRASRGAPSASAPAPDLVQTQVMSHERVRRGFNAALDMMNQVRRKHRRVLTWQSLMQLSFSAGGRRPAWSTAECARRFGWRCNAAAADRRCAHAVRGGARVRTFACSAVRAHGSEA